MTSYRHVAHGSALNPLYTQGKGKGIESGEWGIGMGLRVNVNAVNVNFGLVMYV